MDANLFKLKLVELLKEAGYSTEGIQYINISTSVDDIPRIDVSYFKV